MKYAQIIVDNRASKVDKIFTYGVGPFGDFLMEGMRVIHLAGEISQLKD